MPLRSRLKRAIISIHALLAESDVRKRQERLEKSISIHALLAESDRNVIDPDRDNGHFYPRSPCGERQAYSNIGSKRLIISIHALLAESDLERPHCRLSLLLFLSTLSLRRATRAGCSASNACTYFYPRSPCGERLPLPPWFYAAAQFLSTLSLRRATN